MKWYLVLLFIILSISLIIAFTPQDFDSVDLVLNLSYIAQDFDSVDLVLGDAVITQCSNPINTDWLITDAQVCDNQELNIGTGHIVISTGNLSLINSANVTSSGLNITQDGEKVFIYSNSNLIIL